MNVERVYSSVAEQQTICCTMLHVASDTGGTASLILLLKHGFYWIVAKVQLVEVTYLEGLHRRLSFCACRKSLYA
jgi:hypothetical protein